MNDRELERRIKKAVENNTPDVLDQVMEKCDSYTDKVIPFTKARSHMRKFTAIAAAFVLVAGIGLFSYLGMSAQRIESIISLDVNPSIELCINRKEEVVSANALNADAREILSGMKLKGADVHTATNAIIGSLLKHGYIDELANSILVSVEDADATRGVALQKKLSEEINEILAGASIHASILSQYLDKTQADQTSQKYEISHGKAALIERILEVNTNYTLDELSKLSVNELNLILSNPKNEVTQVQTTGYASTQAYIRADEARDAAFSHAGTSPESVRGVEVDFDFEHGHMIYEVEFEDINCEYDYSIDAKSGEVLQVHKEHHDDEHRDDHNDKHHSHSGNSNTTPSNEIGKEEAKAIAFEHAGVAESQVRRLRVERELDDGRVEFNVEFRVGQKEYEYEISGESGKIIDFDVDTDD